MTFFKCDRCQIEFDIDPKQDEESIERNYYSLYGFFPEDIPEENTVFVCQPCYENYLRWFHSLNRNQQEAITDEVANYYGLKPR